MSCQSSLFSTVFTFHVFYSTGWDWSLGFMRYGQRWRGTRRCFHQHFNQFAVPKYWEKQTQEVHAFLRGVLDTGGDVAFGAIRQ